ncbi:MAG: OmpH family outer membrane protein [Dysgonamonadaceae bacterium]|jgi:outer membrane protein|nr:OmpH family outer membrane protein [Dysgonamonadaceae bacterium]
MLKKIVLLAFLCLPLGMMAQELKIAHVNPGEIFNAMPETAAAETELLNLQQQIRTELQRMEEEYGRKYTEFMQESDSLVQSIKVVRMQEIENLKNRIEAFYQDAEQQIGKARNDLIAPISQKIQNAIKAVGEEHGYTYVMDSGAFIHISPKAIDITPLVKTKLGLK